MLKRIVLLTALSLVLSLFGFSAVKWGGAGVAQSGQIMSASNNVDEGTQAQKKKLGKKYIKK